jgi:hypothetical protein
MPFSAVTQHCPARFSWTRVFPGGLEQTVSALCVVYCVSSVCLCLSCMALPVFLGACISYHRSRRFGIPRHFRILDHTFCMTLVSGCQSGQGTGQYLHWAYKHCPSLTSCASQYSYTACVCTLVFASSCPFPWSLLLLSE